MTRSSSRVDCDTRQRHANQGPLQTRYRRLYSQLLDILTQLDPLGVHSVNTTSLAPEVASIQARLQEARVAEDVERIVLEELQRWYGRRHFATLDCDRLADATIAICTVWNRFLDETES